MNPINQSSSKRGSPDVAAHRTTHRPVPVPTQARWRSVSINPYVYAAVVLILFLGTIQVARFTGNWSTTGRVTASGTAVTLTGADPSELKGWMTIQQVTDAYNVSVDEFKSALGIPASTPATTQLKDLEAVAPDFSVEKVRNWLTARSTPGR